MCFAEGCFGRPSVGAHVQKDRLTDTRWYVVPLCSSCGGRSGQDLDVWDQATLVCVAGGLDSGKDGCYSRSSRKLLHGAHRYFRRATDVFV
jgi:hypothetical protein